MLELCHMSNSPGQNIVLSPKPLHQDCPSDEVSALIDYFLQKSNIRRYRSCTSCEWMFPENIFERGRRMDRNGKLSPIHVGMLPWNLLWWYILYGKLGGSGPSSWLELKAIALSRANCSDSGNLLLIRLFERSKYLMAPCRWSDWWDR